MKPGFNAQIVVLTNTCNTKFIPDMLRGPFRKTFDYIVLTCPTFVHKKAYGQFVDHHSHIFVMEVC